MMMNNEEFMAYLYDHRKAIEELYESENVTGYDN